MKSYLDAIPHGMIYLDAELRVLGWNACMEAWTGIPRQEILGTPLVDRYPYLKTPRYWSRLAMVLEQGGPAVFSAQLHKFFIDCKDGRGKQRLQNATVSPIRVEEGECHILVCIDDVTETVERVAQYRTTRDEAIALANMKSYFTANVSHELRTPMNGILGMAELLLYDDLPVDSKERVGNILSCGRSLLGLLNDILDFSKLEAGRLVITPYDFELEDEIRQSLKMVSCQASKKGLQLILQVDPDIPKVLHGDAARIRQIITNLLSNAVKFTSQGRVSLAVSSLEDGKVEFAVKDTGIGIPAAALKTIFDSYSQVDGSYTRAQTGTGLGLAISKQLAVQMGGDLTVESELGAGSCFVLRLALPKAETECIKASESRLIEDEGEGLGLKILLAEDNTMNRVLAESFLQKLGCECRPAADGREAVEAFEAEEFDLVLLDIQMPEMDGMEAAQLMRTHEGGGRRTPIIALTAHATEGWKEKCLEANMDDFLTKPLSISKLFNCLSYYARSRKPVGRTV